MNGTALEASPVLLELADPSRIGSGPGDGPVKDWSVPAGAAGAAMVTAPGHLPLLLAWPAATEGRDIEVVFPAGSDLEIELVVDPGASLPLEEEARTLDLMPPPEVLGLHPLSGLDQPEPVRAFLAAAAQRTAPSWRPLVEIPRQIPLGEEPIQVTLPAGDRYRWASALPLVSENPDHWLDLPPGGRVVLRLRLVGAGTIRGRLDLSSLPGPASISLVRLYRLQWEKQRAVFVQRAVPNGEGEFVFAGLAPGEYRVDGLWQAGDTWCIAARLAEVGSGWGSDLGLVVPAVSAPVVFHPFLVDQSGAEIGIEPGPPESWPEFNLAPLRGFPDPLAGFVGAVPFPVGRRNKILGMEPGRWNILRRPWPALDEALPERARFANPSDNRSYEIGDGRLLEFPIPVDTDLASVRLTVGFPDSSVGITYHWHFIRPGEDLPLLKGSFQVRSAEETIAGEIPAGRYQFVLLPDGRLPLERGPLPSALEVMTVPPGGLDQVVRTRPGVTLAGRYLGPPEELARLKIIGFSIREWRGMPWNAFNCLGTVCDAEGNFVIHGVPAGSRIQEAFSDQTWVVGSAPVQEIEVQQCGPPMPSGGR